MSELKIIRKEKSIVYICTYCLGINKKATKQIDKITKQYEKKGIEISGWICENCSHIYFD